MGWDLQLKELLALEVVDENDAEQRQDFWISGN